MTHRASLAGKVLSRAAVSSITRSLALCGSVANAATAKVTPEATILSKHPRKPTPTPTATPLLLSAATSTPAPPSLLSLTTSQTFATKAVTATGSWVVSGGRLISSVGAAPSTLSVAYNPASKAYTITVAGRTQTFLPANKNAAQSTFTSLPTARRRTAWS